MVLPIMPDAHMHHLFPSFPWGGTLKSHGLYCWKRKAAVLPEAGEMLSAWACVRANYWLPFQHYYMRTLHLKGWCITSLLSSWWMSSDLSSSVWQKHGDLSGNQAGGKFLTSWLREGEWFQAVENAAFCAVCFLPMYPSLPGTGISLCAQQTDFLFNNTLPITWIS